MLHYHSKRFLRMWNYCVVQESKRFFRRQRIPNSPRARIEWQKIFQGGLVWNSVEVTFYQPSLQILCTLYVAMKGQNIGSSTKKVYKKIFDSDVRNENICLSALLKAMPFALLLKMAE